MKICTGMKSIKHRTVIPSEGEENTTGKEWRFNFKRSLFSFLSGVYTGIHYFYSLYLFEGQYFTIFKKLKENKLKVQK